MSNGVAPAGKLYPGSSSKFDEKLFGNPTSHYRGAPLWSWNCKLDIPQLEEQIGHLSEMGMGGAHIHSRTGLDDEYLGTHFFEAVKASIKKSKEKGMLTWLYDEDRWPSGSAGGLVTKNNLQYAAKQLLFTPTAYGQYGKLPKHFDPWHPTRTENGKLLGKYAVILNEEGKMKSYKNLSLDEETEAGSRIWYAYVELVSPSEWYNYQRYVDTMNSKAVKRFLELTHEKYYEEVGDDFGQHILGIFTDEPQFAAHKSSLDSPFQEKDIFMPWTEDIPNSFNNAYGYRLEERLPELFWEGAADTPSLARYHYHDHISERFTAAFADTIGRWCRDHHINLTGHMMHEDTLQSQTEALGEAMRSYRAFNLPGIDMLFDSREFNTAKQAQSASHQYGREGVMSEIYGVTNWDFTFVGHKGAGDWQAALGITFRVPHLTWVSMRGEAKRDYPASIGYQSPWYREYSLIEDYFSRINVAMTRGRAVVRIGVIHPIESFWLAFGPISQTSMEREERQQNFESLTEILLFDQLDFDFISESLFPSLTPENGVSTPLRVGASTYDVILVPSMRTIRSSTLTRLQKFHAAGGRVIFLGEVPSLLDGVSSPEPEQFSSKGIFIPLRRRNILAALKEFREIQVDLQPGISFLSAAVPPKRTLLHQVREDGEDRWVFICNTDRESPQDDATIKLRGDWDINHYDAMQGTHYPIQSQTVHGWTAFKWSFPAHGSILLRLGRRSFPQSPQPKGEIPFTWEEYGSISRPNSYELSEPNVLVLDIAEFRIVDNANADEYSKWETAEELLRLDDHLRERFGFPTKMGSYAQPWATKEKENSKTYHLQTKFTFRTSVDIEDSQLAIEDPELHKLAVNGIDVSTAHPTGYFVDRHIPTIALPNFKAGTHTFVLTRDYNSTSNLEWLYLLGNFGVQVAGRTASITPLPKTLEFGDWTTQGFPFYAGNITYNCDFIVPETTSNSSAPPHIALQVDTFKAPLLRIYIDDDEVGTPLAFAPYQVPLSSSHGSPLTPGSKHKLRIKAYGSRVNAFGTLHNANDDYFWFGPNAWRTTGSEWCYEYKIKKTGVLVTPKILVGIPDVDGETKRRSRPF